MYEDKPTDIGAVDMVDEGTSDANADWTQKGGIIPSDDPSRSKNKMKVQLVVCR